MDLTLSPVELEMAWRNSGYSLSPDTINVLVRKCNPAGSYIDFDDFIHLSIMMQKISKLFKRYETQSVRPANPYPSQAGVSAWMVISDTLSSDYAVMNSCSLPSPILVVDRYRDDHVVLNSNLLFYLSLILILTVPLS
jgi:hypothetical protein